QRMSIDYSAVLAEHIDRIAALEAEHETEKACILDIYEKLDRLKAQHEANWARIVKLEEAANHPAKPDSSPAPAGGLVERVADAIADDGCAADVWHDIARAAILAVSAWIEERHHADPLVHTAWEAARWLREEVKRHG
ncbi:MAG: hypothetical protein EBU53_05005, partial [Proteobacteria bacterium]|nr:hypothetical protein [Pseudomonadota bacterium]